LKLLEFAVGRKAISTRTLYDLAKNRFASADLYHKTANIQADIGGATIHLTGPFKTLTGGDLISAEKKGLPSFTFTNEATLIFSANELAELKKPDPVFYERFVLVEMPFSFVDDPTEENERLRDPFLEEKLSQQREIDWFTTWAVEGLMRLLENGHYTETKGSKDVMARWVSRTDSLKAFVDSSAVQEVPGVDITKTAFYEAYVQWCAESNMSPISEALVGRRLPVYVSTSTKETRPRSWANITVAGVEAYQPAAPSKEDIDAVIREVATSWRGDDESLRPINRQTFIDQVAARVRNRNSSFAGCADVEDEIDWLLRSDREFSALLEASYGERRGLQNYETDCTA
jgi:putative DNA primase/helicase